MRAAMLEGPGQVDVVQVPVPEPAADEVLIEVKAISVCGSDLHTFRGRNPRNKYPKIMGHEVSGVVVDAGAEVASEIVGSLVAVEPNRTCERCRFCLQGLRNLCFEYSLLGEGPHHPGGCAEFVAVRRSQVHVLPDGLGPIDGALVQPYGISYEGTIARGGVASGEKVLVIGAGPIGQIASQLSQLASAEVMIVDLVDFRLEFAKQHGARFAIRADDESLESQLLEWTEGEGVDLTIEAVGGAQSATLELAQRATARRGRIVVVGEFSDDLVPFPVRPLKNREQTLMGSIGHPEAFEPVLSMMASGAVRPRELITHVVSIEELPRAFELLDTKTDDVMKVLVEP